MKKTIITLVAGLACAAAFAQGKLQFAADSSHLVYYDTSNPGVNGTNAPIAGTAVSSANMPQGVTLLADLYAGTSSTSLSLVSTTTFGFVPGRWTAENVLFNNPALPAGVPAFFQIQIRDNAHGSAAAALNDPFTPGWYGFSQVFSVVPQPSSYNPLYAPTSPTFSTWEAGTFNLDSVALGFKGAIPVFVVVVPEPSSLVLVGVGIEAARLFRRRSRI